MWKAKGLKEVMEILLVVKKKCSKRYDFAQEIVVSQVEDDGFEGLWRNLEMVEGWGVVERRKEKVGEVGCF